MDNFTAASDVWQLACDGCGSTYDLAPLVFGCPACAEAGRLSVLECKQLSKRGTIRRKSPGRGIWGYENLLPPLGATPISLGEGGTPLVPSRHIGPSLGLKNLFFKVEGMNPTGSYKDRYVAVSISAAHAYGYDKVVVSSTGNLAASVAAYTAAAGLKCLVLVPPGCPRSVIQQSMAHGATIVETSWSGRQILLEHLAGRRGWFPVSLFLPRPVNNPFGIEGYRTIAYEILEELDALPAAVFFPCARGNGLYGTWKGFRDISDNGLADCTPKMVACQPHGANSLEVSLARGTLEPLELPAIESIAFSAKETVGDRKALAAIRASQGFACSSSDSEISYATEKLAQEGLYVEPTSALPIACLPLALRKGVIEPDDLLVCMLTANGLRWQEHTRAKVSAGFHRIMPKVEEIDRLILSDPSLVGRVT